MQTINQFTCFRCCKEKTHTEAHTTGYALDSQNNKICYECCADEDKKYMIEKGKITLYLVKNANNEYRVTNWPDSLSFPAYRKKTKFGFIDGEIGYFTGPDQKPWSIHVRGDMECGTARRLKN